MKKFISWILLFSLLTPSNAWPALQPSDKQFSPAMQAGVMANPGFEFGRANWTASGGTLTTTTAAANVFAGNASGSWDSSSASQTLTSSITFTNGGGPTLMNATAGCMVKCASGTCTHTFTVDDGSTNLVTPVTITSSTTGFVPVTINYVVGTGGTVRPKFTSVASNEPILYVDGCWAGPANVPGPNISQVNQASLVGTAFIANTGSCSWSRTNTVLGEVSTTAACPGPTIETNVGPGTIQTTDTDLPRFTVNSLPPGTYWVSFDGTAGIATSAQEGAMAINDGTTTFGQTGMEYAVAGAHFHVEGAVTYSAVANVTFKLFVSSGANAVTIFNNGNNEQTHFTIMRFPSTADLVYNTGKQIQPTVQYFTSGSGATYPTPTGATGLVVTMCGPGGGGSGSGTTGASGTAGSAATTFGTSLLSSGAGGAGTYDADAPAAATNSITAPALKIWQAPGNQGGPGGRQAASATLTFSGASGGASVFGGAGAGGTVGGTGNGQAAAANTGAGGGAGYGALTNSTKTGTGGNAGACLQAYIPNPSSTYTYTIGTKGSGGTGTGSGASNGGNGSDGFISVWEFYGTSQMPVLVGGFRGTQTNDSAPTGYAGEYVSSSNSTAANFPSSGNWGDATSISLTAGDWDVSFCLGVNLNSATLTNSTYEMGISTTTGNSSSGLAYPDNIIDVAAGTSNSFTYGSCIPAYRVSLSATTTYYGKLRANYTAGTVQYNYRLSARRVR